MDGIRPSSVRTRKKWTWSARIRKGGIRVVRTGTTWGSSKSSPLRKRPPTISAARSRPGDRSLWVLRTTRGHGRIPVRTCTRIGKHVERTSQAPSPKQSAGSARRRLRGASRASRRRSALGETVGSDVLAKWDELASGGLTPHRQQVSALALDGDLVVVGCTPVLSRRTETAPCTCRASGTGGNADAALSEHRVGTNGWGAGVESGAGRSSRGR